MGWLSEGKIDYHTDPDIGPELEEENEEPPQPDD